MCCSLKGHGPGVLWNSGSKRKSTKWGNCVLQHWTVTNGLTNIWTGQVRKTTESVCLLWIFLLQTEESTNPQQELVFLCRQSELSVKLNRQLERCLRNSKCIDTESLCVVSGEKVTHKQCQIGTLSTVTVVCVFMYEQVWQIRVDVHVLNHDGNLMDASSIAAITALCHFRRPDVSTQGDEITVVSLQLLLSRWRRCLRGILLICFYLYLL